MPKMPIQAGSPKDDILAVQKALQIQQTGQYGPTTADVVKNFQRGQGLMPSGIVDAATYKALFAPPKALILPVKYFTQRDSEVVARGQNQAHRSCFSSSNGMLLEYMKPGTLPGNNGDDTYLRKVLTYGDTTDPAAQIAALGKAYGIQVSRPQNLSFDDVKAQIQTRRLPVPIGILHKGPVSAPSGGGHWIIAIGFDEKGLIVHDPYGELNLITGQYISVNGKQRHYSYENLKPRFCPGGHDGWGIIVTR